MMSFRRCKSPAVLSTFSEGCERRRLSSVQANFAIRGIPAKVNFKTTPGTYILLTQTDYSLTPTYHKAPSLYAGIPRGPYFSKVAGPDGTAVASQIPPLPQLFCLLLDAARAARYIQTPLGTKRFSQWRKSHQCYL